MALEFLSSDIGTAKPSMDERAGVPHHLIDLIEPTERYSAARFRADALNAAADILARGRLPTFTGGTMLYFKALRDGLDDLPQSGPALRVDNEANAAARGWPALHADLAQVDAPTAARLAPTDAQRIGRALEVFRITGTPLSQLFKRTKGGAAPLPFELCSIALEPSDRAQLHERIAKRFEAMLAAGLVDEVRTLREHHPGLSAAMPSMRCVGYRQVWDTQDGRLPKAELRDRGIFATRQLAKRQITWQRSFSDLERIDCLADNSARQATTITQRFLEGTTA